MLAEMCQDCKYLGKRCKGTDNPIDPDCLYVDNGLSQETEEREETEDQLMMEAFIEWFESNEPEATGEIIW